MTAVRRIVSAAAADGYKFQTIILGIVKSYPFLMRQTGEGPSTDRRRGGDSS